MEAVQAQLAQAVSAAIQQVLQQGAGGVALPPQPAQVPPPAPAHQPVVAAPIQPTPAWQPVFALHTTQNYETLPEYFKPSHYDMVRRGISHSSRLDELIGHAMKLGLVHPSEKTAQLIVALYLLTCSADARLRDLTPVEKNGLLRSVKDALHRHARTTHGPFLKTLPADPAALKNHAETQRLWDAAFETEEPTPFPFPFNELRACVERIPMRMSKLAHAAQPSVVTPQQGQQVQMQQMLPMLMSCMQHVLPRQGARSEDIGLRIFGEEGSHNILHICFSEVEFTVAQIANTDTSSNYNQQRLALSL